MADATWYEWQLRLLQKDNLAASRLRSLRRSQGWYRHRISMGIGRRISTVSAGNCAGKNGLFQVAQKGSANLGQLDSPTLTDVEVNRTLLAGEIGLR